MNATRHWLPLLAALFIALLTGCAAQSQSAQEADQPQLALQPDKPMLLSGVTPASIDEQEEVLLAQESTPLEKEERLLEDDEALLADDLDDWEDDDLDTVTVADPLEWFNRAMYQFNDKLMVFVLKPVAKGYRVITPKPVRTGVSNFFRNVLFPVRFVNCILQGKPQAAEAEVAKFLYNTTVGVLGFGNPSKEYAQLNPDPEDMGQTLGTYGIGDGFYIVWPVLGPSTLRDSIGMAANSYINPVSYIDPTEASIGLKAYDFFNRYSFRIEDIDALKEAAFDPYEATRDLYIQLRRSRINR